MLPVLKIYPKQFFFKVVNSCRIANLTFIIIIITCFIRCWQVAKRSKIQSWSRPKVDKTIPYKWNKMQLTIKTINSFLSYLILSYHLSNKVAPPYCAISLINPHVKVFHDNRLLRHNLIRQTYPRKRHGLTQRQTQSINVDVTLYAASDQHLMQMLQLLLLLLEVTTSTCRHHC